MYVFGGLGDDSDTIDYIEKRDLINNIDFERIFISKGQSLLKGSIFQTHSSGDKAFIFCGIGKHFYVFSQETNEVSLY